METLTGVMERENHHCVLAVSHGGACFNFLRGIQDPTEELKKGLGNCCTFVYEYEDGRFALKEVIREKDMELYLMRDAKGTGSGQKP